jgi:hypothetical protein
MPWTWEPWLDNTKHEILLLPILREMILVNRNSKMENGEKNVTRKWSRGVTYSIEEVKN